jgi:hypothetical protein
MKRKLLVPLAILVSLLAVTMAAVPASAQGHRIFDTKIFWGNICHNTDNQCMNLLNGGTYMGNIIQFWGHTKFAEPHSDFNVWEVAQVNCATGYPFGGSVSTAQCSSWGYDGRPVVKIAYAPGGSGSGWCLYTGGYTAQGDYPIELQQCQPSNNFQLVQAQLFIWTGSNFLVSAFGTGLQFNGGNNTRVWAGSCDFNSGSDADGQDVCSTQTHGYAWNFLSPP